MYSVQIITGSTSRLDSISYFILTGERVKILSRWDSTVRDGTDGAGKGIALVGLDTVRERGGRRGSN